MRQAALRCGALIRPPFLCALALAALACGDQAAVHRTDLAQALDLATATAETAEVLPGDYERRQALLGGWAAPEETAAGAFAKNAGAHSTLSWRLAWSRPLELTLTGRTPAAAGDAAVNVRVSWNEEVLGQVQVTSDAGKTEYRLEVPPEVQRVGSNHVRLEHTGARDGSGSPPQVAWSSLRIEGAGTGARPAEEPDGGLRLPFRTTLDYHVLLPEGGLLELGDVSLYGPQGGWRNAAPPPSLLVSVHSYPAAPAAVTRTLTEGRGRLRLKRHELPIRIRFEPVAGGRLPEAEAGFRLSAVLRSPTHPWPHAAAPPPAPAATGGAPAMTSATPLPHVLIFLVDTLRADHLGCYGYDRPTSPNIDRFAAGAVRFDQPVAQSSWTRPATASILTGLYPHHHGARTRNHKLAEDVPYLPQILRSLGYRALGVSTNGNAGIEFGFRRGFDHFKQMRESATRPGVHVPVWRAVDETLEWLERIGPEDSFFVFLHVTDPHAPYLPPAALRQKFAPGAPAGAGRIQGDRPAGEHTTRDLKDLYDAEIAHVDEHFGRLLDELDRRGFLDDTLLVFVSDHGEEFLDHGRHGHGRTLYQEQIRVPLIIRLPKRLRQAEGGSVVDTQVRQIDIVPTILDAIGHGSKLEIDGLSLLPLIHSGTRDPRFGVAMSGLLLDAQAIDAVLLEDADGRRKLIDYQSRRRYGAGRELFMPTVDRTEIHDLSQSAPFRAGYMAAVGKLARRGSGALTAGVEPAMPARQREALKALGYLD